MPDGMGGGDDIMGSLFGGMPDTPNGGESDKAFREFAKDLEKSRANKK